MSFPGLGTHLYPFSTLCRPTARTQLQKYGTLFLICSILTSNFFFRPLSQSLRIISLGESAVMISMVTRSSYFPMRKEIPFEFETTPSTAFPLFGSTTLPTTCGEILTQLTPKPILSSLFHLQKLRRVPIHFGTRPYSVYFMPMSSMQAMIREISDSITWNFFGYGGWAWFPDIPLGKVRRNCRKLASFRIPTSSPSDFWIPHRLFEDVTSYRLS